VHVLSAELLEQVLQLRGRGEQNQALQQSRARLAVCNFEFFPVGFLVDAFEKQFSRVRVLELVQLEHLVCPLEVLLLLLVEHAVKSHLLRAGDVGGLTLLERLTNFDGLNVDLVFLRPLGGELAVVGIALALLLLLAAAALPVLLWHFYFFGGDAGAEADAKSM